MRRPRLYLLNAHKNLKPKLEFFKSLGLSDLEVTKLLSRRPSILARSLENQITPCVQELRRILGTEENVLKAIKECQYILECNVEKVVQPNISMLISHGVPESFVLKSLFIRPVTLLVRTCRLSEVASEVMKLGFDPNSLRFVPSV
ncbi:transcription termination factor MTERF5, chloroplastic-like [Corylus avellana]|uniref:transcription termination factor MTERF5, chloroplastic-like n=1 Tax=Corylus avellana TaxID=13451 RepID=UPI00286CF47A|nr:transcription termination factor MTERF5, chloroplastic-like [Corylus avellana]